MSSFNDADDCVELIVTELVLCHFTKKEIARYLGTHVKTIDRLLLGKELSTDLLEKTQRRRLCRLYARMSSV